MAIGAKALAALPDTMPEDVMAAKPAEPKPTPEPTPETVEPIPESAPEPTEKPTVEPTVAPTPEPERVTGTVVNLRTGPGTDHATAGQVRVTGRNADGSWLQVADPTTRLWLYGPLTDIDADADRYGGSDV